MAKNKPDNLTRIDQNCTLNGDLQASGDVSISGTFSGNIMSDASTSVENTGCVEGSITAKRVAIRGRLRGRLYGKEALELLEGCDFEGEVVEHPRQLVVSPQASFNARILDEVRLEKRRPPEEAPAQQEDRD